MGKVIGGPEKLQRKFLRLTVNGIRCWILFESLLENTFDTTHIHELEA